MNKTAEYARLTTPFEREYDKSAPWSDYLPLNGEWDFDIDESDVFPAKYREKITVPFPPESRLSGIERTHAPNEYLYYRRKFTLPEGFNRGRVILHFGAVDQHYALFVNGMKKRQLGYIANNGIGGYIPSSHDITDALMAENEICVRVKDELSHLYPWGKQKYRRGGMWYTPVSGIWQTVWLESVSESYIKELKIPQTDEAATVKVIGGVGKKRLPLDTGETFEFDTDEITVTPEAKKLWTPDEPNLYYFTLECGSDCVKSYFALRKIEIGCVSGVPRILLNGKPYFFNALLDQGYYPDGIFLPATSEGFKSDILLAKSLGFNTLRKHIKIEPMIFYHLCDKLGMIVFQDMINNSDYSFIRDTALPTVGLKGLSDKHLHKNKESRRIFVENMYKTLDLLHSTPSVLYYTIFNEGWGQFSADEVYSLAKAYEPTRIIDATSGWFIQKLSDVDSHHVYFKKIKLKTPTARPIIISEFGGYSHRVEGHLFGPANYGYKS